MAESRLEKAFLGWCELCIEVTACKARHKNRVKAKCKTEAWQSKAKVNVSYDEYDGGVRKHNGIVWALGTSNINLK